MLDNNISESENEHVVSTSPLRHITEKSLRDAPPSSLDAKSVSGTLSLSCVGKFTVTEDQRDEQKINKHKEDDHRGTSSHMSGSRTSNIAQPDDARNVGTLVSNAGAAHVKSEHQRRRLDGPEKKQPHNICESLH